jgi:hypothetical protein
MALAIDQPVRLIHNLQGIDSAVAMAYLVDASGRLRSAVGMGTRLPRASTK